MIKLQTKEHLVYFMQSGIMKLSNYDLHFIQNLYFTITKNNPITSNQEALLDKIIVKYKRQFAKSKYSLSFLQSLSWGHANVIESASEFTDAFIEIADNKIYLKCPFSKKFISGLRNLALNPFVWDREEKRYVADLGTYAFKILHSIVPKIYSKVNYCPIATEYINKLSDFNTNLVWNPTLVNVNGNLLIGATNEFVHEAVKDLALTLDIKTISKLAEHGIEIASNLTQDNKIKFAGKYFYETSLPELQSNIIEWLKELDCDCVFFSGISTFTARQEIFTRLNSYGIDFFNYSDVLFTNNHNVMKNYNYIVSINFTSVKTKASLYNKYPVRKIIKVNNSYPIVLK